MLHAALPKLFFFCETNQIRTSSKQKKKAFISDSSPPPFLPLLLAETAISGMVRKRASLSFSLLCRWYKGEARKGASEETPAKKKEQVEESAPLIPDCILILLEICVYMYTVAKGGLGKGRGKGF